MEKKKKKRSLEEIFADLKAAEKEFDDKLEKYGMKAIKPPKEENNQEEKALEGEGQENQNPAIEQTTDETKDA